MRKTNQNTNGKQVHAVSLTSSRAIWCFSPERMIVWRILQRKQSVTIMV